MECSPTRGNWIWLATGGLTVAVAALTAFRLATPGCLAAAGEAPLAARPAAGQAAGRPAATSRAAGSAAAAGRALPGTHPAGRAGPPPAGPAGVTRPGLPGTAYSGRALFYDPGTALGSCTLGPFPPGGRYAALSPAQFAGGHACGTYVTVSGPAGTVRAEVVDLCPACQARTINLSRSAYARIGDIRPGVIPVTYRWLADPPLPGPLALRASAPAPGELAVQVLHHGNRLASVAISRAAAGATLPVWRRLRLDRNDFWVGRGIAGPGPFAVEIIDDLGHRVIVPRVALRPGVLARTSVWMYRPDVPRPARTGPAATPGRHRPARRALPRCRP